MSYPMTYQIEYPEKSSRGLLLLRVFFGWLYVGFPHGIILWLYGIAAGFVQIIAYLAVLFTGKYPKGMFDFVQGYLRWWNRVIAYMACMRDEYPPFSGEA